MVYTDFYAEMPENRNMSNEYGDARSYAFRINILAAPLAPPRGSCHRQVTERGETRTYMFPLSVGCTAGSPSGRAKSRILPITLFSNLQDKLKFRYAKPKAVDSVCHRLWVFSVLCRFILFSPAGRISLFLHPVRAVFVAHGLHIASCEHAGDAGVGA